MEIKNIAQALSSGLVQFCIAFAIVLIFMFGIAK
jgi:hypothetical protein